ncbi:hypothetical protein TWF694_008513 [Orbilia ellipsospora]|uniref:Uncharacterized protein n=1 Tax=Orbilia ellipsospora TaxID=2528407 RepID=A0AAV9XGQ9_9PEZI
MGTVVDVLIQHNGAYDKTIEHLADLQSAPPDVIVIDDDREPAMKSRRTQHRPTKTIRDKYSQFGAGSPTKPSLQSHSSNEGAASPPKPPRRRLVLGKNRKRVESSDEEPEAVVVLSSEEEEEEEEEHEVEEEPEAKRSSRSTTEGDILAFINSTDVAGLVDLSFTDEKNAEIILSHRPFSHLSEIREIVDPKAKTGKTAKPKNIGDKIMDQCLETWKGFKAVDSILKECQRLGQTIKDGMKGWEVRGNADSTEGLDIVAPGESGTSPIPGHSGLSQGMKSLMNEQPKLMAENMQLKPYQILGVQWLKLLYDQGLGCILADEMGLGKTCQVIAFFALLLEHGIPGPHIVVVPPSTIENWIREFQRFCPSLKVEPYYGKLEERRSIRLALEENPDFNVLIVAYSTFQGTGHHTKLDMHFLKQWKFKVGIFDEGHQLKNNTSGRSNNISKLKIGSRVLLTGTPLQNNLGELINLLSFILPDVFDGKSDHLKNVFKYKATTSDNVSAANKLLSHERIKRAKAMMTPFVLRRRKLQVLQDLPQKIQHVVEVDLTPIQAEVYKKTLESAVATSDEDGDSKPESKVSLLMRLRQAAIHPMLSRRVYTDDMLYKMAKALKKHEKDYRAEDYDVETIAMELSWMTDYGLDDWCRFKYQKAIYEYRLQNQEWMESAKVLALKDILLEAKEKNDKVLVFSQFTQVLDILERVLTTIKIQYTRLDGSTEVAARQELIDDFSVSETMTAFLLSTKAGGVGLNLAASNKVVIFDSSFNPFDDLQAEDRAWRIGQTRDVHVTRLVSKATIEENINQLAKTKLMLDASVSGTSEDPAKSGEMVAEFIKNTLVKEIFNVEE